MKVIFEYDPDTGEIKDANGTSAYIMMAKPFDTPEQSAPVLELIKQGVTPDEIIKLRNNGLL